MTVSAQTGLNWFLLSQPKKDIVVIVIKIFGPTFCFFLRYDDVNRAEGHTEIDIGFK